MEIQLEDEKSAAIYHLMIQTIVPRPIAWILTNHGSVLNLAPFSFFMGITSNPPLLAVSIGQKRDGSKKDTWANIEDNGDFVIHIPGRGFEKEVTMSSAELARDKSEVTESGLTTVPFEGFSLPRLAGVPVAFACTREQIIEIGNGPQGLIIGKIQRVFLDDSVVTKDPSGRTKIEIQTLDPLARLGGNDFGFVGETLSIPRPGH